MAEKNNELNEFGEPKKYDDEGNEYVYFSLPEIEGKEGEPEVVVLNGIIYNVLRGELVYMPRGVKEILKHAGKMKKKITQNGLDLANVRYSE